MTRAEDATNGQEAFGLLIALEDTNWLQNDDKRRTARFVDTATRRIELSRIQACRWYQWQCLRSRRALQVQIDAVQGEP